MNAAPLTSPRLAAVVSMLRRRGDYGATTAEIQSETGSMAVHSDVAEIRANGLAVDCKFDSRTEAGRKVYRYTLIPSASQPEQAVMDLPQTH